MSAVVKGTSCTFGVAGTVTNLYVQAYSVNSGFNVDEKVSNETGLTVSQRLDDRMCEVTVDGVVRASNMPDLGATFTFTCNTDAPTVGGSQTASYSGHITRLEEKGGSREFAKVTVTAICYEAITS